MNIVFESVRKWHKFLIYGLCKQGNSVSIIEPFHAYHHKTGIRFFPPHLPPFVEHMVQNGQVSILKANDLGAKGIYPLSTDKAVDVIDSVFPEYRNDYRDLFKHISDTLKSPIAENVFRISLCNRLAEFYSLNILLHRIERNLGSGQIIVYPDMNVRSYLYIKRLLSRCNQEFFEHTNVRFSVLAHFACFIENLRQNLISITRLAAQTMGSGLLSGRCPSLGKKKKAYTYGVAIVSPRQLRGNQRSADFIIDDNRIRPEEVVYFPITSLTREQRKFLRQMPGAIFYPPKAGRFFSHFKEWKRLFLLALREKFLSNAEEVNAACHAFLNYFRWLKVMEGVTIKHFMTHCDFGMSHVGRNLALNKSGVQTWYFTDSANSGSMWKGETSGNGVRHPFWTYLYYDHLVTWNDFLAQYHKDHPGSFKQIHVAGCLWSGHIRKKEQARKQTSEPSLSSLEDCFALAAFDSTYSMNGVTSYDEGLVFAKHLLQLADDDPDLHIFLKEKKDRNFHCILDPILGPKLLDLYNKMDAHPRINVYSNQLDASELISVSDMVISFPFTSTTFEALSANRPAIWHDPMGFYGNTPYGKVGGVTTHGYEELRAKVFEIKDLKPGAYQNPIPTSSPLMDPYCDGKAIDRFRDLLVSR